MTRNRDKTQNIDRYKSILQMYEIVKLSSKDDRQRLDNKYNIRIKTWKTKNLVSTQKVISSSLSYAEKLTW